MSILDLAEFKKSFEKSERYATAALEIKKLNDCQTAVKNAKAGAARLSEAQLLQQQIERSTKALKAWENGLSAPFKAVVVAKKVFALLKAESDAAAKTIAKETAAKKDTASGPSVEGQVLAQKVALMNLENDLSALERYGNLLRQSLPSIKNGSIAPADIMTLEAEGKKQLGVRDRLKVTYMKSRADFSAMAGPGSELTAAGKTALMGLLNELGNYLRKIEAVPDIPAALDELKALRKRMADNTAGLTVLLTQASDQAEEVAKALTALDAVAGSMEGLVKDLQQKFPDPKTTRLPANKVKETSTALSDLRRTLEFRTRTIAAETTKADENFDAFSKRAAKLLGADTYKGLAKSDQKIAAAGDAITKSQKDLTAQLAAVRAKTTKAAADGATALTFVTGRLPDYVDAVAAAELAKKTAK
jgi:hypothetical protein